MDGMTNSRIDRLDRLTDKNKQENSKIVGTSACTRLLKFGKNKIDAITVTSLQGQINGGVEEQKKKNSVTFKDTLIIFAPGSLFP